MTLSFKLQVIYYNTLMYYWLSVRYVFVWCIVEI